MSLINIFSLCISLFSILMASLNINAQSGFNLWKNVSPPGQGNIVALEYDFRKGRVYAAEETEGLFMSKNGGKNWNEIFGFETGIFNNSVGVKIPANIKGVVFYALQDAVYESADSGKNWRKLTRYEDEKIVSFDVSPDATRIYIAGRKWIDVLSGKKMERVFRIPEKKGFSVRSIYADPYLISRIYITFINGDTAFLEKKEGEWKEVNIKSITGINLITGDPWTPGRIFAVAGNRILARDDKDGKWKTQGKIDSLENSPCLPVSFFVSKRRVGLMFISYSGCGVYMSRDGGIKWVRTGPKDYFVLCIAEKLPGRKIICGTLGDGIILWSPSSSRWKRRNIIGGYINNFFHSGDGLNNIYAVTYSGRVFKSKDLAQSWKEITPRNDESFLFFESFISEGNKVEIAVDVAGVCYTRGDKNDEWEKRCAIVSGDKIVSLFGTTKGIYVLTENNLLYSYDGKEWKVVCSSDKKRGIRNVKVSPAATGKIIFISGNKIYIAKSGFVIEYMTLSIENSKTLSAVFGSDETIYTLSDNGNIYSRSNTDGEWQIFVRYPEYLNPLDFLICSGDINDFYILGTNGNLYRTSDRGKNWFQVYKNNYPSSLTKAHLFCGESKVFLFNDYAGILKSDTGFSFSAGTAGMGWRSKMISFPVESNEMRNKERMRLGRFIRGKWQLYSVSKGNANKYKKIKYLNQLKNSRGYWLIYSGNVMGTIPGSPSKFSSSYDLSLVPGWNMPANPFPYEISVSQIEISSGEGKSIPIYSGKNIFTARGVWKWSASKKKYIIPEIIGSGDAFWIKNLCDEKIKIKINPLNNGAFRKSDRKGLVPKTFLYSMPPLPVIKKPNPDN